MNIKRTTPQQVIEIIDRKGLRQDYLGGRQEETDKRKCMWMSASAFYRCVMGAEGKTGYDVFGDN